VLAAAVSCRLKLMTDAARSLLAASRPDVPIEHRDDDRTAEAADSMLRWFAKHGPHDVGLRHREGIVSRAICYGCDSSWARDLDAYPTDDPDQASRRS
jgi:hypothetical protein